MIPKIIHYCWFGGNPLPNSVKKCIKSWRKYCPDYQIIEWNEHNYDLSRNQYMLDAYREKKWGFVPDFARLDIVYRHGGIYLDTDVQIIRSFDSLLNQSSFFGFENSGKNELFVALGLGFAAEKGNELIKKVMDSYNQLSFYDVNGDINLIPSPQLNTKVFVEYGFIMNNKLQEINGNYLFPNDYFNPKSFKTGLLNITENTYSIHHYDASWYDEELQKEKRIRWKREIKQYKKAKRKDIVLHIPNRILMSVLGSQKYEKLKRKIKK